MESSALALNLGSLTTGPLQQLGTIFNLSGGRKYKYVQFANTSTIDAGTEVFAVLSSALGLEILSVDNGQKALNLVFPSQQLIVVSTGAVTEDEYAGGYAKITSGSDVYSLRISHNTGTESAGNVTLLFEDSLENTVSLVPGTDTVDLYSSPDIASTTTSTGNIPVGYAVNDIPAQTNGSVLYGYTQIGGFSAVTGSILTGL